MKIMYAIMVILLAAQQQRLTRDDLPQSPLEAFAARPNIEVVWSKVIGNLESEKARATVTALILEDTTSITSVMRGVRVDLAHTIANPSCDHKYVAWRLMCKRINAAIYIEDGQLERMSKSIAPYGAAHLRPCDQISYYKMEAPGVVKTGLIVCGYEFADRQPGELAELLNRAIKELRAGSR